jgi:hypothetical protein
MRNSYYNAEHYYDPTAGCAIENVAREERKINRPPKKSRGTRRNGRRRR